MLKLIREKKCDNSVSLSIQGHIFVSYMYRCFEDAISGVERCLRYITYVLYA